MTKIMRSETTYYEEEIPKTLAAFKHWGFSSGGTTGEDFKVFARKYKNHIQKQLKSVGLELTNFSSGHYIGSGFVTNGSKFVYFSYSDVRHFPNSWFNNILIRTAEHEKDYTGGHNNYTTLENFAEDVKRLITRL